VQVDTPAVPAMSVALRHHAASRHRIARLPAPTATVSPVRSIEPKSSSAFIAIRTALSLTPQ
jgi:hypothetical protein